MLAVCNYLPPTGASQVEECGRKLMIRYWEMVLLFGWKRHFCVIKVFDLFHGQNRFSLSVLFTFIICQESLVGSS